MMAGLAVYFVASSGDDEPQAFDAEPAAPSDAEVYAAPEDAPAADADETEPVPPLYYSGTGTWNYAEPTDTDQFGQAGTLLKYNVAVEGGIGIDVDDFSSAVHQTLSDDRSWTAGRLWRFQQVGAAGADFTIYLASPEQRVELCGGLDTTVSCRNGDSVVINSARWISGVEHWDGTLDTYRQYVINHEVGHRLDHPHEVCPEKGELSPVMAQQTFKLAGCVGNPWPYPDGETYLEGPPGEYGGPDLPPDDYED